MGYQTEFEGQFTLDKPLSDEHAAYLRRFAGTRRMQRAERAVEALRDPVRDAVGLPIGAEGGFFVGGQGSFGQDKDASVVDYNRPPKGQPGLWCQWVPSKDGGAIEWDGGEKFYDYVEWLEYLIASFFAPWGYVLDGEVRWRGEDPGNVGTIAVHANAPTVRRVRW